MNQSRHVQKTQALQEAVNDFFELLAIAALKDAHNLLILLHFIDSLALEELSLRLKQDLGQGPTTQLKDQP